MARARNVAGAFGLSVLLALAAWVGTSAQSPPSTPEFITGKNVDVVGPYITAEYDPVAGPPVNPFFLGDPDKKQQNEPSCDISPDNPQIIFCGMNDYRAVDRTEISGEPWVSAGFSNNGGLSWKSHLVPGFKPKAIGAPAPLVTPLGYDTAADPVVRLVPGMGLYTFIAFNRSGNGALLLSRWRYRNSEGGSPYELNNTVEIAKGTGSPGDAGRFLDKPGMTVGLKPGTSTYNFVVPDPTPTNPANTRVQKVPAGIVHVAYAVFTGNNQQEGTKIVYTNTSDYGDHWAPQTTISEAQSVNQAADIAVDPPTSRVVIVWRRFASGTQGDAVMYAISTDDGKQFSKPAVLANLCSFTQNTTSSTFRVTTHPFVTFDGTAFHAVWAERQGSTCPATPVGESKIVISDLSFNNAGKANWSSQRIIDAASPGGHEFQPGVVAAGNRILISWMRSDVLTGFSQAILDAQRPYIRDFVYNDGTVNRVRRRTADIYVTEALSGQTPTFAPAKKVSRYLVGVASTPGSALKTLERNNVNLRMFQNGSKPFHGDYIAASGLRTVLKDPINNPGEWVNSPGVANVQPVFHLAWTDNRRVRGNLSKDLSDTNLTSYTPPPISADGEPDPSTPRAVACVANQVTTRDQTVMGAGVFPPLILGSSSASKPTTFKDANGVVQQVGRAYTVFIQNTTGADYSVLNGNALALSFGGLSPAGTTAFFDREKTITTLSNVEVPRHSSAARTVYVTTTSDRPVIKVVLTSGSQQINTYINANPYAAPLEDPPDLNGSIADDTVDEIEVHTPTIEYRASSIGTPAVDDPAVDDPAVDDPAVDDPAVDDPAVDDPAVDDPAVDDPAVDDPAVDDPAVDDPAVDDPAVDDAAISSFAMRDEETGSGLSVSGQTLTQITWKVVLTGNTTTSMSTKVFVNAPKFVLDQLNAGNRQLIVSRRYRTSDVRPGTCTPNRVSNFQVIANVVNPVFENYYDPATTKTPDLVNPPINQPSFTIPPGGAVYLTVRVWGNVPGFTPNQLGAVVGSQPDNPALQVPPEDDDLLPVAPVAISQPATSSDQPVTTNEDTATGITLSAIDVDSTDPLIYSVVTGPSHGSLSGTAPNLTYTPYANFNGSDSFTFKANDGTLDSNVATVSIVVNPVDDPTVAGADGATVLEDSGANAINVLSNDSDGDGPLTVTAVTQGAHGSVTFTPTGVSYTPAADYNGPDSFTYTASDGTGGSAVGTVNVTVTAVNDLPVAGADAKSTVLNVATQFPASDLTANDSPGPANEATQTLTVTAVFGAANGTVSLSGGQVTFTPATGYTGNGAGFSYTVCDSAGGCATGNVVVTVQLSYTFVPNFPATANQGSVAVLNWQYRAGTVPVNTAGLVPVVRVIALTSCNPNATETGEFFDNKQTPGNSDFQYSTSTFTWKFNWQTKPFPAGCYNIYIRLLASNGTTIVQDNGPIKIQLKK